MTRRNNREAITRLFQGIVKDYGPEPGEQIIKAIIDVAGGMRISIPSPDSNWRRYDCESVQCLLELHRCLNRRFGDASGKAIMKKIIVELGSPQDDQNDGGCRLTFPRHADLYREERARKIRTAYFSTSPEDRPRKVRELAINWGMDRTTVLRIVSEEG